VGPEAPHLRHGPLHERRRPRTKVRHRRLRGVGGAAGRLTRRRTRV
jgi:hypothetical protein